MQAQIQKSGVNKLFGWREKTHVVWQMCLVVRFTGVNTDVKIVFTTMFGGLSIACKMFGGVTKRVNKYHQPIV